MVFLNSSDQRLARRAPTGSYNPTFPLPKCTDHAGQSSVQDWSSNTSLTICAVPSSPRRGRSKTSFLRWCMVLSGALLDVLPHAESRSAQRRPTSERPPCTSRDNQPLILWTLGTTTGRWTQRRPPIAVIGSVELEPTCTVQNACKSKWPTAPIPSVNNSNQS